MQRPGSAMRVMRLALSAGTNWWGCVLAWGGGRGCVERVQEPEIVGWLGRLLLDEETCCRELSLWFCGTAFQELDMCVMRVYHSMLWAVVGYWSGWWSCDGGLRDVTCTVENSVHQAALGCCLGSRLSHSGFEKHQV